MRLAFEAEADWLVEVLEGEREMAPARYEVLQVRPQQWFRSIEG
jgi:hypothetical protein